MHSVELKVFHQAAGRSCATGKINNFTSFLLQERHPGDSKNYNECIRHETMRVAVCDMLEGKVSCPEALL